MKNVSIKRIYEDYQSSDGFRILADRLWPRGIKKENAHIDLWLKEIAPTTELRKWFNHEPEKWEEFTGKYIAEITTNPTASQELLSAIEQHSKVTLLYGAKNKENNQAVVLKRWLDSK